MAEKIICYVCGDLEVPASLRKLWKFTTCATNRGFRVVAVWPGYLWQNPGNEWKLNFLNIFNDHDFCAVVVDCEFFYNVDFMSNWAEYANERRVPLVVWDLDVPGAISIRFDDEKMFGELLEHLAAKHGAKDIFFAGDEAQPNQMNRYLEVYRKFMEGENISVTPDRIATCNTMTGKGMERIAEKFKVHKPEAVVCSSSVLGTGVVSLAESMGYSVPADLLVAANNSINQRRSGVPDLTSGSRNISLMADKSLELIEKVMRGEDVSGTFLIPMTFHLSESCGCGRPLEIKHEDYIKSLLMQRTLATAQERNQEGLFEHFLKAKTIEEMGEFLRPCLPTKTFLCLRDSFASNIFSAGEKLTKGEKFHVFVSADKEREGDLFDQAYLYRLCKEQGDNAAPLILYPVYIKGQSYGFVVSASPEFLVRQQMMGRFLLALCHNFSFFVQSAENRTYNERIQVMNESLRSVQIRDPMTGLYNFSGLVQELEKIKTKCLENRESLSYICVDLDRLGNINDIYGHSEGDCAIIDLAEIIKECVTREDICAHLGSDEFIVFLRTSMTEGERAIDSFVSFLKNHVDDYNKVSDKEYTLNINVSSGRAVVYEDTDFAELVDNALSDKRLTKNNRKGNITFGAEELNADELKKSELIQDVIDRNRFRYAYQPIVSAVDGSIFGYEALMRTDTDEPISPLTIIKYASTNQRLYDIERATFFNVLKDISEKSSVFDGKKIFINSIPGYQIDQADFEILKSRYPGIFKKIFIEVTEQTEQDDEELRILTNRSMTEGFSIAIDDYGCGYANTTALLRYTPNCVKIDRLLITNIHSDPRKQHFVKNIIEFAHDNNFLALAEGVETADELKASIALGVDLIQGFYLARPGFEVPDRIPQRLVMEIEECNRKSEVKRFDKLYVVSKEKELMLTRIGLELYTEILLSGQNVSIVGNLEYPTAVKIRVKENTDTTLTIRNIILDNEAGDVGIEIGDNATLTLNIEGENYINSNGIRVPASSVLKLQGGGNLHIRTKCSEAFGIGNDLQHPFGNIITDITGELEIDVNGDKAVGIGGCVPGRGVKFQLKGGNNKIKGNAGAFVGIGAFAGGINAEIAETHFVLDYNVINGVGIGSPTGRSNVRVSNAFLEIYGGGKSITGIGSASRSENNLEIVSAQILINMNAPRVIMIGCPIGKMRVYIEHAKVELFGSGGRVLAAGCADMGGEMILRSVGMTVKLSSDNPLAFGMREENMDLGTSTPEVEIISYTPGEREAGDDFPNAPDVDGPPFGAGGPPPGAGGPPPEVFTDSEE